MGAGASSSVPPQGELATFNGLCSKYGVDVAKHGPTDVMVLDDIKHQWQSSLDGEGGESNTSPGRGRGSGDRGPVATVVSLLRSLRGSKQSLTTAVDRCRQLARFVQDDPLISALVDQASGKEASNAVDDENFDVTCLDSDGSMDEPRCDVCHSLECRCGTRKSVQLPEWMAGVRELAATDGGVHDDSNPTTTGEQEVARQQEQPQVGGGGHVVEVEEKGALECKIGTDSVAVVEARPRSNTPVQHRCQACHCFVCRCRVATKENREERLVREKRTRAEARFQRLVSLQDNIRKAVTTRMQRQRRHTKEQLAAAQRPGSESKELDGGGASSEGTTCPATPGFGVLVEERMLLAARVLSDVVKEQLVLVTMRNVHKERQRHLSETVSVLLRKHSDPPPPSRDHRGSPAGTRPSSPSSTRKCLPVSPSSRGSPSSKGGVHACGARTATGSSAAVGGHEDSAFGLVKSSPAHSVPHIPLSGMVAVLSGFRAVPDGLEGGALGVAPGVAPGAAPGNGKNNATLELLLSQYCKTMQEQVSLSSLLPQLLQEHSGNEDCFDQAGQAGLFRTLKMKGRLLDAVNRRLATQLDHLNVAIREQKSLLDQAVAAAEQARFAAVATLHAELGAKLECCQSNLAQVDVLETDMAERQAVVEPLANPCTLELDDKISQLQRIEETSLELEDAADDIVLRLKKQRRRRASETSLQPELTRKRQTQVELSQVRQDRRRLLSELAALAGTHFPELLCKVPGICGESFIGEIMNGSTASSEEDAEEGNGPGGGTLTQWSKRAVLPRRGFDEYRDLRLLSSGGDRHPIYVATLDGRDVVLKGFAQHNVSRRRELEKEIAVLSRLRHDALITVQALVLDEGGRPPTAYLELPYYREGNLEQWLRAGQADPRLLRKPWQMQSVMHQVLCGVVHLHDHGIIHKDIKPENILVREGHRAVITDFEMHKDLGHDNRSSSLTRTHSNRGGTQGFIAPEVQLGQPASTASDMYSMGVVLFRMHYNRLPNPSPMRSTAELAIPHHPIAHLVELLRGLLTIDPDGRPTATAALMAAYFRVSLVEELVTSGELVDRDRKLLAVRNMFATVRADNEWSTGNRALHLSLKRGTLVDQVIHSFRDMTAAQLRGGVRVSFDGEAGVDTGGVLTEMYSVFFSEISNPKHGLFERRTSTGYNIADTPGEDTGNNLGARSYCLPRPGADLDKLSVVGKVAVKCVYDGRRLGTSFSPCVFKFIASVQPDLRDLELYDPVTARSMRWMLVNAGGADEAWATFSGLKPSGANIPVTDVNKHDYVHLKVKDVLVEQRKRELQALKRGFMKALRDLSEEAQPFMCLLSHTDWRLLFCGQEYINSEQVVLCLRFQGFGPRQRPGCLTPQWLTAVLRSFSDNNLRRFLIFVTGTPSLPAAQLASVEPTVIKVRHWPTAGAAPCRGCMGALGDGGQAAAPAIGELDNNTASPTTHPLPRSHSCFNILDLPEYTTQDMLGDKLLAALEFSAGGEFGLE